MTKEYLIEKESDQKGSKKYEYFRNLESDNGIINNDSFSEFLEQEKEDKNMAFFIDDKVKFLSYSNPKKFYKSFLKNYKNKLNQEEAFSIYLYIRDNDLKEEIDVLLQDIEEVYDLTETKEKTK